MNIGEFVQLAKEKAAEILSAAMKYSYEENLNNDYFNALSAAFTPCGVEVTPPRGFNQEDYFKPLEPTKRALDDGNPRLTQTRGSYIVPQTKASKWSVLTITEKELLRMPKKYRPDFRIGKTVAHVRQKDNGVYEIRCQIDKRQITASSKNLETAKSKFIAALKAESERKGEEVKSVQEPPTQTPEIEPVTPVSTPAVNLSEYMLKWLETFKKPFIKENTYKQYLTYFNSHIAPAFGDRPINSIKPFETQEFINNLVNSNHKSTAMQCKVLLAAMFDYAVVDDIITKSPMLKTTTPHIEPREGVPLTRQEEKQLVDLLIKTNGQSVHVQACVFMLYTGLRRSELASVEVKDGWVNLISAKGRKDYKAKTRSVPVSPMLAAVLPYIDIERVKNVNILSLSNMNDYVIPGHHIHELRHTFITRCQECGIRREIVSLWAGHAADNSITSQVYTHLQTNKDIQLEEIKKFKYNL